MESKNVVKDKSFAFAVRVVRTYQYLVEQKKEYVLSKQLLRSGTSVGAMLREAEHAESRHDFSHKLAIAQKEINESIYWLELLKETNYLNVNEFETIHEDAVEIIKLLTAILKTTKSH
jgi:four helix bundle protein